MSATSPQFSNRPLYLQVRDALAERIAAGAWKPDTPIPNEGDLAREAGVSSGTMRKALELLESERLVTRRQGRGTFVNDQASNKQALRFTNIRNSDGERIVDAVESNEIVLGEANDLECERLGLNPRDPVYRIRRVRTHNGRRYMVDETSMPANLFPGLAEQEHLSQRIGVILAQYSMLSGRSQERVSIGKATPAVAGILGLKHGSPVLVLDRVANALDGGAVEWRVGYCHLVDEYYMAEMS
jgi:GntR family transcriptional regulator